jgi:hypothetical protein
LYEIVERENNSYEEDPPIPWARINDFTETYEEP